MSSITVTFEDGTSEECPVGTPVGALSQGRSGTNALPPMGALVNNDVSSLSYPLTVNCDVTFLSIADSYGWRIYRNSLCFLLAKVVWEQFPDVDFSVDHSFGLGLYCSFTRSSTDSAGITSEELERLTERMREIVEMDLPIERRKISFAETVTRFEESGQRDKINILKYRNPPRVVVHWCDGYSDLAHGPLVPSTAALPQFDLIRYEPGFVLHLPARETPDRMTAFVDQPHLFNIFQEHKDWGRILGVSTVGALNEKIATGGISEFIRTAEALHEKKVAMIADQVAAARDRLKLVLIAGPSCAGKTTFAKRLTTQLSVNGIRTATLSVDDYFVNADINPVDDEGKPDYEHIEAVDLELLNDHLAALVRGEQVMMPHFDFEQGNRDSHHTPFSIADDQIIIIEGTHGLNPQLTHMIGPERKFKVYVSALTQLSVDAGNRISTTDNRLMRRIVRDNKFRGRSALGTLQLWPSVRRGEKKWIFPFQREADSTFNSALDYELAVLKLLVEPLLMQVKPMDREYAEARRLSEFLLNFLGTSDTCVPRTSILREYIGHSGYSY